MVENGRLTKREVVVASEYENLTRLWMEQRNLQATFVRSYGATEVFPPEDADCIVDNTATGSTLQANGLVILDEVMRSSTRLYAQPRALEEPEKRGRIEEFVMLLRSVIEARSRVLLEINVVAEKLDGLVAVLPCLRQPTVSSLALGAGFAVKVAVPRRSLPELLPLIRQRGGTDTVVIEPSQIVL